MRAFIPSQIPSRVDDPVLMPYLTHPISSLVAQMVKRLPTMRETWVQSLGPGDPLEKKMAPHSSTLGWKIL